MRSVLNLRNGAIFRLNIYLHHSREQMPLNRGEWTMSRLFSTYIYYFPVDRKPWGVTVLSKLPCMLFVNQQRRS